MTTHDFQDQQDMYNPIDDAFGNAMLPTPQKRRKGLPSAGLSGYSFSRTSQAGDGSNGTPSISPARGFQAANGLKGMPSSASGASTSMFQPTNVPRSTRTPPSGNALFCTIQAIRSSKNMQNGKYPELARVDQSHASPSGQSSQDGNCIYGSPSGQSSRQVSGPAPFHRSQDAAYGYRASHAPLMQSRESMYDFSDMRGASNGLSSRFGVPVSQPITAQSHTASITSPSVYGTPGRYTMRLGGTPSGQSSSLGSPGSDLTTSGARGENGQEDVDEDDVNEAKSAEGSDGEDPDDEPSELDEDLDMVDPDGTFIDLALLEVKEGRLTKTPYQKGNNPGKEDRNRVAGWDVDFPRAAPTNVKLPDCEMGVVEMMTFLPLHTYWPRMLLRMLATGWSPSLLAKFALAARGLYQAEGTTKEQLEAKGRVDAKIRQQKIKAGELTW
jgi:hypothetical protein